MPMFVDPNARVAVTLGENTVYIKAKMSAGTKALLEDEIKTSGAVRRKDGEETIDDAEMSGFGSYGMLLRIHNIVAWEGPDFSDSDGKPIPCNRANIMRLDPTDPLYELVGERIGELNKKLESPDPN
jgi:hypothetical protein